MLKSSFSYEFLIDLFQGFTYVAPSIIEDMSRLHHSFQTNSHGFRSPRKILSPELASQTYYDHYLFSIKKINYIFLRFNFKAAGSNGVIDHPGGAAFVEAMDTNDGSTAMSSSSRFTVKPATSNKQQQSNKSISPGIIEYLLISY
jgi:hypothetical protein